MRDRRQKILDDPESYKKSQVERRLPDDFDDLPEDEQQEIIRQLEEIIVDVDPSALREEILQLSKLIEQAKNLEKREIETKLVKLREVITEYHIFDDPKMRLLIFTEHKETLDYLAGDGKDGRPFGKLRVEVKGDKARLLPVAERTKALFGKSEADAPRGRKKKKEQLSMFAEIEEAEEAGSWGENTPLSSPLAKGGFRGVGNTTLDRLHQAMILFAAGRGEALKRFLIEEGVGRDERFWRLAQALSALYPKSSDEKRWVDGVLARKKGLGF